MGSEQRKHARHLGVEGGVLRLAVRPEFGGRQAKLVDVSAGGLAFLLQESPFPGAMFVFELRVGIDDDEPMTRIARVRHCRSHPTPPDAPWLAPKPGFSNVFRRLLGMKDPEPPPEAWLIRCELDPPLTPEEIEGFLAQLQASARPAPMPTPVPSRDAPAE